MYKNGPVMTSLLIYEDFYSYKSGIYSQTAGNSISGHAMRIVGWGHDNKGFLFWICQNQWGPDWGDKGYIRIKAGQIEIDDWGISCEPEMDLIK